MKVVSLVLALVFAAPLTCVAEEPEFKIPPEGSWARYLFTLKRADSDREFSYLFTAKVLGREDRGGRPHRWFEIEYVGRDELEGEDGILKVLVPEKSLQERGNPIAVAAEAWNRDGDEEPYTFNNPDDFWHGQTALLFPAAFGETRAIDESRTLDVQSGRLEMPTGRTGTFVHIREGLTRAQEDDFIDNVDYRAWSHEQVPFAFAEMHARIRVVHRDKTIAEFTQDWWLEETGRGATSKLLERE